MHVLDKKNETKYRGMRDMEHEYKVGDMVRIIEDEYVKEGLTIGSVHPVDSVDGDGVYLKGSSESDFFYRPSEIRLYTTTTTTTTAPTIHTTTDQYIRILEAIAGEQLTTMARNIHEALQDAP